GAEERRVAAEALLADGSAGSSRDAVRRSGRDRRRGRPRRSSVLPLPGDPGTGPMAPARVEPTLVTASALTTRATRLAPAQRFRRRVSPARRIPSTLETVEGRQCEACFDNARREPGPRARRRSRHRVRGRQATTAARADAVERPVADRDELDRPERGVEGDLA